MKGDYVLVIGGDPSGGLTEGQTALYLLGLIALLGLILWVIK